MYLALDKTSAACFTHGLCLCPVFLLSILHPNDPAQHLCRRFEDAQFTFERSCQWIRDGPVVSGVRECEWPRE